MRLLILGTGALACLFAARLQPFAEVQMLGTWAAGLKAIGEQGIRVHAAEGTTYQTPPVLVSDNPTRLPPADIALVLVKSWQTARAAQHAQAGLTPQGWALTLQNGLGNAEQLAAELGPERVHVGITTQGAALSAPGVVQEGGAGQTTIGQNTHTQLLADLFNQAGIETHLTPDVTSLLWGKLAINAGINPVTALLGLTNGQLADTPAALQVAQAAADEVQLLASAQGIDLPFAVASTALMSVANNTRHNHSSMLQDMIRNAPTEIEAINGQVVNIAAKLGLAVPTNTTLYHLIQAAVQHRPIEA